MTATRRVHWLAAALVALLAAACTLPPLPGDLPAAPTGSAEPTGSAAPVGPQAPAGFVVEPLLEGLVGPTQMVAGPDGLLWVAHLNGSENAGVGQVLAINPTTGERRVLLENLLKPTGLAVVDGALWVATRREIWRAPLVEGPAGFVAEAPALVLDELPFNGRSNGTLTVTPWGTILYETSGSQMGGRAADGSAAVWELDPATFRAPTPRAVATGLKGGYAHTVDADGRLWIVEIGDDPVNGVPPPDELNVVRDPQQGAAPDFGWPACFGMAEPATNLGGTPERCAETEPPVVLFPPRSTPVSVTPAPWDGGTLLVALWLQNEVVAVSAAAVDAAAAGGNSPATATPFLTGIVNPQALLPWSDGSLLVAEYGSGRIHSVRPGAP